jgi:hypothetical protein
MAPHTSLQICIPIANLQQTGAAVNKNTIFPAARKDKKIPGRSAVPGLYGPADAS